MYLIMPTKYDSIENPRFGIFKNTLQATSISISTTVIIVDSSPIEVYRAIQTYILELQMSNIILLQIDKTFKKGHSIRFGISHALSLSAGAIIGFQEPEKVDMIQYYNRIIQQHEENPTWVCVPKRSPRSWSSYPIEQQHSEQFANSLLKARSSIDIDWFFGPILFTSDLAHHWIEYDGDMWDAQVVPLLSCIPHIRESTVDFQYPTEQKQDEQYNSSYIEKRYYQLNQLVGTVTQFLSMMLHHHLLV